MLFCGVQEDVRVFKDDNSAHNEVIFSWREYWRAVLLSTSAL
jgi:hypothetical protein